jgi:hypothetical protein
MLTADPSENQNEETQQTGLPPGNLQVKEGNVYNNLALSKITYISVKDHYRGLNYTPQLHKKDGKKAKKPL